MSIREQFCNTVASRIGCPYIWGARGPDSFDCCGLVEWGFEMIGKPFTKDICSAELLNIFHNNKVIKGSEKLGSLYLYSTKQNRDRISHVCIYFRQWKNGKKWLIGANGGGSKVLTEDIAFSNGAKVSLVTDDYRSSDLQFIVDPFINES